MTDKTAGKKVPKHITDALGVAETEDGTVVVDKEAEIRCPQCGDGRINVQPDHATCLNCGYNSDVPSEFVSPHAVYIKVVPDDDASLTREQIRFQTRCPECGSRDLTFFLNQATVACNACGETGPVVRFYAPKAHAHPGAGAGDEEDGR